MDQSQLEAGRRVYTHVEMLAGAALFGAVALFIVLGVQVLPEAIRVLVEGSGRSETVLTSAMILNVALILFSWRRCKELRLQREARLVAETRALTLATRDFMTKLLNRGALTDAAEAQYAFAPRETALLVLDLDFFKKVNDHYGHAAGDALLRVVADRIVACSPPAAICGRLGGDEFAVVVGGASSTPDVLNATAAAILESLSEPVEVDGGVARIGASIGLARATGSEGGFGALLRHADIAMYQAKKQGRNCFAWFDASMEAEISRQNQLESEMRAGIPDGQFVPYYQPQFNIRSGELHGFEVLARWNHPRGAVVEPDDFIPLAEVTGLIAELSMSVMRQALVEASEWDPSLMLAVNVSPVQLRDPLLDQRIMKLLVETGFPAKRLELEITESALFDDMDVAIANIESLKELGVTISLDDFGTGYSSLAQLRTLPFDRIKIDRSFVLTMLDNEDSAAIVSAIATLGESLQVPVTAEGIESNAILEELNGIGCTEGQGWLYGRPLTSEQLRARFPNVIGSAWNARAIAAAFAAEQAARTADEAEEPAAPKRDRRAVRRHGVGGKAA